MRVVVADDDVLLREGLVSLLSSNGFEVAAQVGSAVELMAAVKEHEPDVAVIDVRMPPSHTDEGIRAAEELAERYPAVAALVLSQYVESAFVLRLLEQRSGGRGYLLKEHVPDVETLVDAVRTVGEGGSFVDPELVRQLLAHKEERDPLAELTAREREILALMAEGRSNRAIYGRLFLSPKTVETHIRSIFMKLNLMPTPDEDRRVMAVLHYLRGS
jgi:DNA-binding NarL/FixJ family response regulator